jgi:ABC-2 type transport system permease protein
VKHRTFIVARREFLNTAANKAFFIVTLLGPFLLMALTIVPALLTRENVERVTESRIAVIADDATWDAVRPAFVQAGLSAERYGSLEAAEPKAADGDLGAAIVLSSRWYERESFDFVTARTGDLALAGACEAALAPLARAAKALEAGVDPAVAEGLVATPSAKAIKAGAEDREGSGAADAYMSLLFTMISFVMLLYMTVLLYGQLIGRSVLQEKTSKTAEIMLSSIDPGQLLLGKILGNGLAGLLQYGIWVSLSALATNALAPILSIRLPDQLSTVNMAWLVACFGMAYCIYSSIYAALGAAADDEQRMGQLAMPFTVFLMLPLVAASPIIMDPRSAFAIALSHFPLTSPIVMLVRIIVDTPEWYEIAISFALMAFTAVGVAFAAGRVFRVGILTTGKKKTIGEILRWISYR